MGRDSAQTHGPTTAGSARRKPGRVHTIPAPRPFAKMKFSQQAREIIEREIVELQALAERVGPDFDRGLDLLKQALDRRNKIIVCGVGKSDQIGSKFAATLNSTGAPAVVLHAQNALHGDLGIVSEGDVAVILSYSGETEELVTLLPHLRRFASALIGVTGHPDSSLGRACDVVLDVKVGREACPLNLAPTSSSTAMLVLSDALAMVLMQARGFRSEDFAALHPNGALGQRLLLTVADVMRTDSRLPLVRETGNALEALKVMTGSRAGAAIVVDADGRLAGVFTHGDFARCYQSEGPALAHKPLARLMTANPVTIRSDRLAVEAVRLFEEHRIDDLIVIDADNRPVGLIDSQDLSRMRLV